MVYRGLEESLTLTDQYVDYPMPMLRRLQQELLFSKAKEVTQNVLSLRCIPPVLPQPMEEGPARFNSLVPHFNAT